MSYFNLGLSADPFGGFGGGTDFSNPNMNISATPNDAGGGDLLGSFFAPNAAGGATEGAASSSLFSDIGSFAGSSQGAGMLGGFASSLGAKGGAGTGGMFTTAGSMFGPIGTGVGAVLDIGFSSKMADKAQNKAKKAAKKYWKDAKKELAELKRMQDYEFGGLVARQGGTGIQLNSKTPQLYRAEFARQQQFQYDKMKKEMKAQRDAIKKSGGKGGLF